MFNLIAIGVLIVFTVGMVLTEVLDYQEREAIEEIKNGNHDYVSMVLEDIASVGKFNLSQHKRVPSIAGQCDMQTVAGTHTRYWR